jgi:DnaJ like chaperone protein
MKDDSPIHILWLPTIAIAGIAYVYSLIDFVPDAILGIGWLDDLVVIIALVWFFTSWVPKNRHRIYWFRPQQHHGTGRSRHDASNAGRETTADNGFDPFRELDVKQGASAAEIERAYRRMLAKYHPDKVAHLGEEFQHIAHEKVITIKKAYEMLCGKG